MDGLFITIGVLGATAVGIGSIYLLNRNTNKNPYDLTDQIGNTRTSYYNQWNPSTRVDAPYHPTFNRGGSKRRKHNKKKGTKRH
jgi:hypothetical protein